MAELNHYACADVSNKGNAHGKINRPKTCAIKKKSEKQDGI